MRSIWHNSAADFLSFVKFPPQITRPQSYAKYFV